VGGGGAETLAAAYEDAATRLWVTGEQAGDGGSTERRPARRGVRPGEAAANEENGEKKTRVLGGAKHEWLGFWNTGCNFVSPDRRARKYPIYPYGWRSFPTEPKPTRSH
jgi:hypothetical protein